MSDSPEREGQGGRVDPIDTAGGELESMDYDSSSRGRVYYGWDKVTHKTKNTVSTIDDNAIVYGVGDTHSKRRSHMKASKRRSPSRLAIALSLVFILGICVLGWRVISGNAAEDDNLRTEKVQKKTEVDSKAAQPKESAPQKPKPAPKQAEPQKQPSLTAANIVDIVTDKLMYGDEDVKLPIERFKVDERNGYVMVFQDLEASVTYDPKDLVTTSSKRIVALAHELAGKRIGEGEGTEFADATLIVRGSNGRVYLAICEGPTDERTSDDPYGLIKESRAYTLSSGLLASLGADSGLVQRQGDNLTDLNGVSIVADAAISTGNATANRAPAPVYAAADDGGGQVDDGGDDGDAGAPQDGGDGGDNAGTTGDNGGDAAGNADNSSDAAGNADNGGDNAQNGNGGNNGDNTGN